MKVQSRGKIVKLEDHIEQNMIEGIDPDNCGKVSFIDDNDEYYLIQFELSSGEKFVVEIWKDEMSAEELFDKFLSLSEQCARYMSE